MKTQGHITLRLAQAKKDAAGNVIRPAYWYGAVRVEDTSVQFHHKACVEKLVAEVKKLGGWEKVIFPATETREAFELTSSVAQLTVEFEPVARSEDGTAVFATFTSAAPIEHAEKLDLGDIPTRTITPRA